jgi:hypothetical protein
MMYRPVTAMALVNGGRQSSVQAVARMLQSLFVGFANKQTSLPKERSQSLSQVQKMSTHLMIFCPLRKHEAQQHDLC